MLSKARQQQPDVTLPSQHIPHHDRQPDIAATDDKLGVFELGRAHTDFWILRHPEPLFGEEKRQIHSVVAVLIMDQGNGVGAWGHIFKTRS